MTASWHLRAVGTGRYRKYWWNNVTVHMCTYGLAIVSSIDQCAMPAGSVTNLAPLWSRDNVTSRPSKAIVSGMLGPGSPPMIACRSQWLNTLLASLESLGPFGSSLSAQFQVYLILQISSTMAMVFSLRDVVVHREGGISANLRAADAIAPSSCLL